MCVKSNVCVCVCRVHVTETLIRDIERHFAPVLSDDKITTRPEVCLLASSHGGIRHSIIGKFMRGNHHSSLIPGSPLRTALISNVCD